MGLMRASSAPQRLQRCTVSFAQPQQKGSQKQGQHSQHMPKAASQVQQPDSRRTTVAPVAPHEGQLRGQRRGAGGGMGRQNVIPETRMLAVGGGGEAAARMHACSQLRCCNTRRTPRLCPYPSSLRWPEWPTHKCSLGALFMRLSMGAPLTCTWVQDTCCSTMG